MPRCFPDDRVVEDGKRCLLFSCEMGYRVAYRAHDRSLGSLRAGLEQPLVVQTKLVCCTSAIIPKTLLACSMRMLAWRASLPPELTTRCVAPCGTRPICRTTSAVTLPSTASRAAVEPLGRSDDVHLGWAQRVHECREMQWDVETPAQRESGDRPVDHLRDNIPGRLDRTSYHRTTILHGFSGIYNLPYFRLAGRSVWIYTFSDAATSSRSARFKRGGFL